MCKVNSRLVIPEGYTAKLGIRGTEIAIKQLKDFFQEALSKELNLTRVSAPIMVKRSSGLNDDLNGVERPVRFDIKETGEDIEIVHSLAKWKRMALKSYEFCSGEGLYTDMNAIRRDEDLDNLHSIYVDQWDWEKIIDQDERNIDTLKTTVSGIFQVFKGAEEFIFERYPTMGKWLPEDIFFITSQELLDKYPELSPKERENAIAEEKKAVFIIGIGDKLSHGERHDGRAPDYDDWKLNGDIIFWNPILQCAFELSSMGIRVDEAALDYQLKVSGSEHKREYEYHKALLEGRLPYTIGGGIGQSRICMYFLRKAHIGEVQASVWSDEMIKSCEENGMLLL